LRSGRLDILLIDDEESDRVFAQQATKKAGAAHNIHGVHSGEEAVYLRGVGPYADRQKFPLPNVILTDLKMPNMDGFAFLRWLRNHPKCSVIPTIVYSSSPLDRDVREAYRLGANAYIIKPSSINEMIEILRLMYAFWSRCECPPPPSGP